MPRSKGRALGRPKAHRLGPPAIFLPPIRLAHNFSFQHLFFRVRAFPLPLRRREIKSPDALDPRRPVRHPNEQLVRSDPNHFSDDFAFVFGVEWTRESERQERGGAAFFGREGGREGEVAREGEDADRDARVWVAGLCDDGKKKGKTFSTDAERAVFEKEAKRFLLRSRTLGYRTPTSLGYSHPSIPASAAASLELGL